MENRLRVIILAIAVILLVGLNTNLNTASVKNFDKVIVLQGGLGVDVEDEGTDKDKKDEEKQKEESENKEEIEEEEEEELDYELGKVDPNTKKATRYVCKGCGEVQLQPFKCEICEKDAEKEELDVEEKNGKWFIKGTNTQVVEKEPDEEEEESTEESKEEKAEKSEGGSEKK